MLNRDVSLSVKMNALPDDTARLLATWMIAHLDCRGVFYADPAVVRSLVFPMRPQLPLDAVSRILDAMEAVGLIVRFEALGRRWQYWPGFGDNQPYLRVEKERSDYPPPPKIEARTTTGDSFPINSDSFPTNSDKIPTAVGKMSPEVEEEEEEEKEVEEKSARTRATPHIKRARRGFGEVITSHDDPRVAAYLEIVRPEITPSYAEAICHRVPPERLDEWRATLTLWASNEWRATNFAGMFERFDAAVNGARVRAQAPAGRAKPDDKFEAALALIRGRAEVPA